MCTAGEVLPSPEDATPEIPIDEFTASALGFGDLVSQYLDSGASVNRQNREGWSMLQYAAFIGHQDVVKLLLERGADPNIGAPLNMASKCGNESIIITLLNGGASHDHVDTEGLNALQQAVSCGQDGSVTVLLRHYRRPIMSSDANVLLHRAVTHGNVAVLKALLNSGLTPSPATRMTMIEVAHSRGNNEVVQAVMSCNPAGGLPPPTTHDDPFSRLLQRGPLEMQKLLQSRVPANMRAPGTSPTTMFPPSPMGHPIVSMAPNNPPPSHPSLNSVSDVMKHLKLEKYAALFEREDIDMSTFLTLTDSDLKAISIDLLGPRKKILNYINLVQSGADQQSTTELQLALIGEQQTVRTLREKLKQERDKETGNQQMIQSLFMSYQGIREKKDRILTSLTNALYVIEHIQSELMSCREIQERLPRFNSTLNSSADNCQQQDQSLFALSWPGRSPHLQPPSSSSSHHVEQDLLGEHIALASVNSVLEPSQSPFKDDKMWLSCDNSSDASTAGGSTSTLSASFSYDRLRKHLECVGVYLGTLFQHLQESKAAASNINTCTGM